MIFQTKASGIFQEDHWYIWHIYLITAFGCPIFQSLGKNKDPKFPQNLRPTSLLSRKCKLFEKVILKIVQRHIEEIGLLNASQFGFGACQSMTLQWMKLMDHVTLNFNNNMYTAAVFLEIWKAFDTIWHLGLPYKLSKLKFSINSIKLISSFLSQKEFRVSVEDEMSMPSRDATRLRPVPHIVQNI
jgi:hypothetical protein